jgi:hypothetical protein
MLMSNVWRLPAYAARRPRFSSSDSGSVEKQNKHMICGGQKDPYCGCKDLVVSAKDNNVVLVLCVDG